MSKHDKFIKRTFELALKGIGNVSPNPLVGAVIVKDDKIVGEGYHEKYGESHAEVNAINNSGLDNFSDCTIYINLEPCSHYGKTPPCADLLIEKKFKRVVISNIDPNPLVSGKGIEKLKNAGIEVITDICKEEGEYLNRFFFKNQIEKRAYSLAKVAQSLDGCTALNSGESKWITNEASRRITHTLRSQLDAILVGKRTAITDNPQLTTRLIEGKNPKKIALDTNLNLPLDLKIFKDDDRVNTIIVCSTNSANSRKADILRLGGIKILGVDIVDNGLLNLEQAFHKLFLEFNISSVLIEGGSTVHSYLLENNLIDELHIFTAPIVLGNCKKSFHKVSTNNIQSAKSFKLKKVELLDDDIYSIYINK